MTLRLKQILSQVLKSKGPLAVVNESWGKYRTCQNCAEHVVLMPIHIQIQYSLVRKYTLILKLPEL